jgi:phosphate transport system ATP-binding protein
MYDLYPGQRAEGKIIYNGKNILDADQDINSAARQSRYGISEADAFPMSVYDNIAFGVRLYENLLRVRWMSALNGL